MQTLEWALNTRGGLLYNVPALALLGWTLWRRPVVGLVLTGMVYLRVFEGVIPFSMHACLSGFTALSLPGYERMLGIGLALFTAYWYLWLWEMPDGFWGGIVVGGVLSLLLWASQKTIAAFTTPDDRPGE